MIFECTQCEAEENKTTRPKMTDQVFCNDRIPKRKMRSQNLVCRLYERERGTGIGTRRGSEIHLTREFYKSIYPNTTVVNVEKPAGFLRKFSPDGKHLIAFTYDQTSLEIYRYKGVVAAAQLMYPWITEVVPNSNTDLAYDIRSQIFDKLFKVCHNDHDGVNIRIIYMIKMELFHHLAQIHSECGFVG